MGDSLLKNLSATDLLRDPILGQELSKMKKVVAPPNSLEIRKAQRGWTERKESEQNERMK